MSNKRYDAYASILAGLARELLALYADDHDSVMFEWGYDHDEIKAFDSEVERISKRIDYLESKLERAERTCKVKVGEFGFPFCSECGASLPDDYTVYFCWNCGAKVVE